MANSNQSKLGSKHPDKLGAGLRFSSKTLSIKTVSRATSPDDVLPVCLSHNLRQENEDHRHRSRIDAVKSASNEVMRGPQNLAVAIEVASGIFDALGIVPSRRDAIMGLEFVFQPPDGADAPAFWVECLEWAANRYQHIVSAVVHRDQARPHMHLLALAVSDGRLAGNAMTAGKNRLTAQSREFMAHMRDRLNLRPDRKAKTLADLALSIGRGPKTRAAAARSDAAMATRAKLKSSKAKLGKGVAGQGGLPFEIGNPLAHADRLTPLIAQLSRPDMPWQELLSNRAWTTSLTVLCMAA